MKLGDDEGDVCIQLWLGRKPDPRVICIACPTLLEPGIHTGQEPKSRRYVHFSPW
jgi:hypothetical protein